ncbi:hypothetical protein HanIR_Chr09g0424561 [Helianthus annuus]|nr:hypothetical protein HanIR_Chr09g0424561 [Helianthus annuus]
MTPPKGLTQWKRKFFYVKACAVYANMTFRDVNVGVTGEDIPVATAKTVDWFSRLRPIELKKLDNNQLWVLRMMLTGRIGGKACSDAPLWRMFEPDFEGKVELIACGEREGFNLEIVGNFRVPTREILNAPMLEGEGTLGNLGKFEKPIPKKHVEKKQLKKPARGRGKEKIEGFAAPPLVSQAAGISRSCYHRYTDFVLVSDTLEGLGVPGGGGAAAGGTAAGSTLAGAKRKPEQKTAGVGEVKHRKLQSKRAGPTQQKSAVAAEPEDKDFSIFDAPSSPTRTTAAEAGVPKESATPFVKVVPNPTQIFDTVDSSNNLISPNDADNLDLRFSDAGKQKSGAGPQKSTAGEKVTGSSSGGAGYGDDISNDPYACREILGGLGTPFEVDRARAASHELRINQLSTMFVGSSVVANAIMEDYKLLSRREEEAARMRAEAEKLVRAARAGAEQLEKDKAAFEKHKQTEEWAAFIVDTEALLEAAVASFYDMSLSSVEKLDECLDAADYVDRLRMLYADAEEEDTAGDGQDGAGTSGTK